MNCYTHGEVDDPRCSKCLSELLEVEQRATAKQSTRIEELEGELGECLTWIGNTKNHAPYEAAGATWRTRHNEDQREIAKLKSDLAALQLKWTDGEKIARLFHETYERFAPAYNYETRSDTKEFDPDTENGRLMIAVVKSVALAIQQPQEDADG